MPRSTIVFRAYRDSGEFYSSGLCAPPSWFGLKTVVIPEAFHML